MIKGILFIFNLAALNYHITCYSQFIHIDSQILKKVYDTENKRLFQILQQISFLYPDCNSFMKEKICFE